MIDLGDVLSYVLLLQQRHVVVDDFLMLVHVPYGYIEVPVVQTSPFGGEFVGIGDDGAFFGAYKHHKLDWWQLGKRYFGYNEEYVSAAWDNHLVDVVVASLDAVLGETVVFAPADGHKPSAVVYNHSFDHTLLKQKLTTYNNLFRK